MVKANMKVHNRFTTMAALALLLILFTKDSTGFSTAAASSSAVKIAEQPVGDILILDHLNINHQKGKHAWLKSFYFDFLQCAVDPRKQENLEAGRKTVWANIGANQFHLPEGKPEAQVLDGIITLSYPDLSTLRDRYAGAKKSMKESMFDMKDEGDCLVVTDPWGSQFHLVPGDPDERDTRGKQPGGVSEGLAMRDLTIYTSPKCNLEGIGRFYEYIFEAPILESVSDRCVISVGPRQTLTFASHPQGKSDVSHADLRDDQVEPPANFPAYLSNYGPHVSMYVANLPSAYRKAEELGVAYVNPRFKRRAYSLEQAIDQCMFRCLDIVDPANRDGGVILQLEHEVRSVITGDGSKYKSCPFDEIRSCCKTLQ